MNSAEFKNRMDEKASQFLSEIGAQAEQKILDFGCGSGTYTIPAAKIVGGEGKVYSIDKENAKIKEIAKKAKRLGLENIESIKLSEGEKIPLKRETINLFLLIDVLHEVKEKIHIFKEINRLLKEDGLACVYPMHMKNKEVISLGEKADIALHEKRLEERILIMKKGK